MQKCSFSQKFKKTIHLLSNSFYSESVIADDDNNDESMLDSVLISDIIRNGTVDPRFDAYEGAIEIADNEINSLISDSLDNDPESSLRDLQSKITDYLKRFR